MKTFNNKFLPFIITIKNFKILMLLSVVIGVLSPISVKAQVSIAGMVPTEGTLGSTVEIIGSGFNEEGLNEVYFGHVKTLAKVENNGTRLFVEVPPGARSVTDITVVNTANGSQASTLTSATPFFNVKGLFPLSIGINSFIPNNYNTASRSLVITSGDFDNDGSADLVTASFEESPFEINFHRNNGKGLFESWNSIPVASGVANLKVGDLDGDGNLDIVAAKRSSSDLELFRGGGDGNFEALPEIKGVTGNGAGLALGDLNNDGFLDIVTTFGFNNMAILLGDGKGNFIDTENSPLTIEAARNPGDIVLADFNNDGFLDIACLSEQNGNVLVFTNNQDNSFSEPLAIKVGTTPFQMVSGFFNEDQFVDLAVLNTGSSNLYIIGGDEKGLFSIIGEPIALQGKPQGLDKGDFDGDGITDLLVGGSDLSNLPLFKGDGKGTFTSFPGFPIGDKLNPSGVISGDFNNDGLADIANSDLSDPSFNVLLSKKHFITHWSTNDRQIRIPTNNEIFNYNYTVYWENTKNPSDKGFLSNQTGDAFIEGLTSGVIYKVIISETFPSFFASKLTHIAANRS